MKLIHPLVLIIGAVSAILWTSYTSSKLYYLQGLVSNFMKALATVR